jgi:thiol-disulfide isomerase/thioredoxin
MDTTMKKFLLLTLVIFLFGCSKKSEKLTVILNGEIKNAVGIDSVMLRPEVAVESKNITTKINEKGIFKFTFEISKPTFFSFNCGKEYTNLFLSPGDSVFISIDYPQFDSTLKYSGTGSEANNYLAMEMISKTNLDYKKFYGNAEKDFVREADSIYNSDIKRLEDYANKNSNLNKDFVNLKKIKYLYSWARMYNSYPSNHAYYSNEKDFKPSGEFEKYLSKVNLNDSTLLDISEYTQFLRFDIMLKTSEIFKKDTLLQKKPGAYIQTQVEMISKTFTDPKIKEYMTYSILYDELKYSGLKLVESELKKFTEETKNVNYKNNISTLVEKWKKLAPGTIIPEFTFIDINGKNVALSSFKGKYLYIDTWATWCGPCRGEIPDLKKLEEKYHDKNIVFISISIDDDKAAWENFVEKEKLQGVQLYIKGWENPYNEFFMINSIPRFILIDREGKIIDANAERPSGKIEETIAKLEGI